MKPFVEDGTSPVFGLWSVPDLGYLAYQVAAKLVSGEITGTEGETFTVKGLNGDKPYTIGKDSVVILGPAFRFDKTNVERLQLLGRAFAERGSGPGGIASGARRFGGGAMERVGFTMRLLPGPGGRVPAPPRRRLAGDARRAAGGRRPRLLDLHARRRTCSPISWSTTSRAFRATMAASAVNARWQAEMAALIDPLTDPATGFHQRLEEIFHLD